MAPVAVCLVEAEFVTGCSVDNFRPCTFSCLRRPIRKRRRRTGRCAFRAGRGWVDLRQRRRWKCCCTNLWGRRWWKLSARRWGSAGNVPPLRRSRNLEWWPTRGPDATSSFVSRCRTSSPCAAVGAYRPPGTWLHSAAKRWTWPSAPQQNSARHPYPLEILRRYLQQHRYRIYRHNIMQRKKDHLYTWRVAVSWAGQTSFPVSHGQLKRAIQSRPRTKFLKQQTQFKEFLQLVFFSFFQEMEGKFNIGRRTSQNKRLELLNTMYQWNKKQHFWNKNRKGMLLLNMATVDFNCRNNSVEKQTMNEWLVFNSAIKIQNWPLYSAHSCERTSRMRRKQSIKEFHTFFRRSFCQRNSSHERNDMKVDYATSSLCDGHAHKFLIVEKKSQIQKCTTRSLLLVKRCQLIRRTRTAQYVSRPLNAMAYRIHILLYQSKRYISVDKWIIRRSGTIATRVGKKKQSHRGTTWSSLRAKIQCPAAAKRARPFKSRLYLLSLGERPQ